MFGECFDFGPQPKGRARRQYIPPVQIQHKLTPREQANRLASSAGIDASLLDGVAESLIESAKMSDVRSAMQCACSSLQQGKNVPTELSETSLSDFLLVKVARLPIASRFPLMAEWTTRLPAAWNKSSGTQVPTLEGQFMSFDDGRRGSRRPDPLVEPAPVSLPVNEGKKKKEKKKKQEKQVPIMETFEDEEMDWQAAVPDKVAAVGEPGVWQEAEARRDRPGPVQVVKKGYTDTLPLDTEQMKKEAVRREEEAKSTASKVLLSFQQTRTAAEAGMRAAKESEQRRDTKARETHPESRTDSKNDAGGELEEEAEVAAEPHRRRRRRRRTAYADPDALQQDDVRGSEYEDHRRDRASRSRSRHDNRRFAEQDRDSAVRSRRGHNDDYEQDRERHDRGRRGSRHSEEESYDRERSDLHDDYDGRVVGDRSCSRERSSALRRHSRSAASPPASRSARATSPGDDPDDSNGVSQAEAASKRKKNLMDLFRGMRSESPDRGQRRKVDDGAGPGAKPKESHGQTSARGAEASPSSAGAEGRRDTARGSASSSKAPAPVEKTENPTGAQAKPERKLRQLAFKNGWAEYVEEGTGVHVYKNVFTGEMTRTKPQELMPQITVAQNERRLSWLASHRAAAMMGEGVLHGAMPGAIPGRMPGGMPGMGFGR